MKQSSIPPIPDPERDTVLDPAACSPTEIASVESRLPCNLDQGARTVTEVKRCHLLLAGLDDFPDFVLGDRRSGDDLNQTL